MGTAVFITGTDTDVGKTWVTTRLIQMLRIHGVDAVGMKPIECGGREDSTAIHAVSAASGLSLDDVNPLHFAEPVAPAAVSDPVKIDFDDLKSRVEAIREQSDFLAVEGAGGWLVPLDETRTVADLAAHLDLPVVIVASNRLGVLNHTLLTVRAIREQGLTCLGVFLNLFEAENLSQKTNAEILTRMLDGIPVFDQDLDALAEACLRS